MIDSCNRPTKLLLINLIDDITASLLVLANRIFGIRLFLEVTRHVDVYIYTGQYSKSNL